MVELFVRTLSLPDRFYRETTGKKGEKTNVQKVRCKSQLQFNVNVKTTSTRKKAKIYWCFCFAARRQVFKLYRFDSTNEKFTDRNQFYAP